MIPSADAARKTDDLRVLCIAEWILVFDIYVQEQRTIITNISIKGNLKDWREGQMEDQTGW